MSEIIGEVIKQRPDILNSSDRKVEHGDLYAFDSLESLKKHFSEKFVESQIRKNRTEQFNWLSQTLQIPMTKDLEVWPKFVEINERRNLLTHTGGIVSSAYLKNCRDAGYKVPDDLKIGDKLNSSLTYFKDATSVFFEVGIKLIQVVWRKVIPNEIVTADGTLIDAGLRLINDDRLQLAFEIHRFANDVLKNVSSDRSKRVLLVNYANCQNLLGNHDEASKLLSRMDWSAAGLDFEVCVAAVRGEANKVASLMGKAVTAEAIGAEEFRTWPVFRNLHKEKKFQDAYKKAFGTEFVPGASTSKVDLHALMEFLSVWTKREHASPEAFKEVVSTRKRGG